MGSFNFYFIFSDIQMMNDEGINDGWITILSTTRNKKITQRGRYLEVNTLQILKLLRFWKYQIRLQVMTKATEGLTELRIVQRETEYLMVNNRRVLMSEPSCNIINLKLWNKTADNFRNKWWTSRKLKFCMQVLHFPDFWTNEVLARQIFWP